MPKLHLEKILLKPNFEDFFSQFIAVLLAIHQGTGV